MMIVPILFGRAITATNNYFVKLAFGDSQILMNKKSSVEKETSIEEL